jgi:AAA15 family ATPase/GTPase
MLTAIHIQGFKGFKDTNIEPLRRVNLIVGGQNSGKTSLLEALEVGVKLKNNSDKAHSIMLSRYIKYFLKVSTFRQNIGNRQLKSIAGDCQINPKYSENTTNKYELFTASVYPVDDETLVGLYSAAVNHKTKNDLIKLLKEIEPRLETIENTKPDNEEEHCLHIDIGLKELTPLSMLGHGFNRLVYLYAGLLGQKANCALIDEIENGIHYSALPTVWQGIVNIAQKLDIQLFITTHSWECILAASHAFKDTPQDFQIIRLEHTEDQNIAAVLINDGKLTSALNAKWEIR